jgi:hypothetical protein
LLHSLKTLASAVIYLDESGDLGWKFDQPYRRGGSSRHLTIAALVVPSELREHPKRVVRKLYGRHKWATEKERKWSDMDGSERKSFADQAAKLKTRLPRDAYCSITVRKENVEKHIRADENKLYNYMIRLLLVERMRRFDEVTFVPDERAIKVKSGNSLHDYLQMVLWFELEVKTRLSTMASDSSKTLNLQFVDMLSGVVQSHYEDKNSHPWTVLGPHIQSKRLFF